jgi:hypothetical protein
MYVRAGAGTNFGSVGSLNNGTTIQVVSPYAAWAQIAAGQQHAGNWLSAQYIVQVSGSNPVAYAAPPVFVQPTAVPVEQAAGMNMQVLDQTPTRNANGREVLDVFAILHRGIIFAIVAVLLVLAEAAKRHDVGDIFAIVLAIGWSFTTTLITKDVAFNILSALVASVAMFVWCLKGADDFTPLSAYFIGLGALTGVLGMENSISQTFGLGGGTLFLYGLALFFIAVEVLRERDIMGFIGTAVGVIFIVALITNTIPWEIPLWTGLIVTLVFANVVKLARWGFNSVRGATTSAQHANWICVDIGVFEFCVPPDATLVILTLLLMCSIVS